MSHEGNDELRERFAEDVQEMSHREKVMTLLGFFYDSDLWITADTDPLIRTNPTMYHRSHDHDVVMGQTPSDRKEKIDTLLIEVMHHLHLHDGDAGDTREIFEH